MKLGWDRPGVVRATLKVEELAALVAGARLAAAALSGQSTEQAEELERVLVGFDRAVTHLGPIPDQRGSGSGEAHGSRAAHAGGGAKYGGAGAPS